MAKTASKKTAPKKVKTFWGFTSTTTDNPRDAQNLVIASNTNFFPLTSALRVKGRNHSVSCPIQISKEEYDTYPLLMEEWEKEKKMDEEKE